ncbi:immunity 50 family protein [Microbulbifer sp. CAU 1566]|uniref:Imm50 family immunity protein n=1 Tax=Microbulbifer sp. CAU 1566 TaxID=2933269 RepID=UPI002004612F|nr:Imm50 family immunity protein [Microbulbifer sp. CAU 1566]MCK7599187.1 immunity 50 family protein [Microbulbifer sp. CAU 1566]
MQVMSEYQKEVVSYFGYWPVFCDAPIKAFREEGGAIELVLEYIDSNKNIQGTVSISFYGVTGNSLSEYEPSSVIDTLKILEGKQFWVSIEPCYGMGGSFKCTSVVAKIENA